MASLVILDGPNAGQRFSLSRDRNLIGRQPDTAIYLESLAVSRQHAQIVQKGGAFYLEDLGSSNGTFLNGFKIKEAIALAEHDRIQIGPYTLALRPEQPAPLSETNTVVRARVEAASSNQSLYLTNPANKLRMVLEISQHLGHTLELEPLLNTLLEQLIRLFPQADRGMVVLCEGDRLIVRAQRGRHEKPVTDYPFSRTLVRRALDEGVGLLSEDVSIDPSVQMTSTLMSLNLRSFLCVPLLGRQNRKLGVIQLDCIRSAAGFRQEDLEMLTALAIQVSVVLENAALHAERLREARLKQDLLMARDIQQSFLPKDFNLLADRGVELFARVYPAREVSGDLYDFFLLPDGRLAFCLGDVSGKGMPAALFMIAVRTLLRLLTPTASGPSELMQRLNHALVADNPTNLYVTLAHGIFDPADGSLLLACGGHPPPLLRRKDGKVEEVPVRPGALLGSSLVPLVLEDTRLTLNPGELLVLYTDGITEAYHNSRREMFGVERLQEVLCQAGGMPLEACSERVVSTVSRFTGEVELQDDQTLFLLRRR
jgi:serine phosphatase RsbU (regulator of sigma subunit)